MKNIIKIFSILALGIFLLSAVSAMTVYADFADSTQSATITVGDSVSFNVDFFSMQPPITSMKAGLYSGTSLIQSFLDSSSTAKTYYTTYTYTASTAGTYKIKVIGTDNTNTDSEFLTLTVNPAPTPVNHAPVITSSSINQINEEQIYSYNADATDADSDTLTYSLVSSPSWLSINSATGVISGTALAVSSDTPFTVEVKVTDEHGATDTQSYTLTVKNIPCPINHAPVISHIPNQQIDEGDSYNYHVVATDEDGDALTYSLTSAPTGLSMVPPWLSIDSSTGIISGSAPWVFDDTPFTVTVHVSDGTASVSKIYTLTVKDTYVPPVNNPPEITLNGANPQIITKGDSYHEYEATAWDDEDGDLTSEIIIDSSDVDTDVVGTYFVTYSVEDSSGNEATKTRTVKVVASDDDECDECTHSPKIIEDNSYDKNKYFNQFQPRDIVYSDTSSTQKTFKFSTLTLFYLILAIIGLGIIIAFFLIFRSIRNN